MKIVLNVCFDTQQLFALYSVLYSYSKFNSVEINTFFFFNPAKPYIRFLNSSTNSPILSFALIDLRSNLLLFLFPFPYDNEVMFELIYWAYSVNNFNGRMIY